MLVPGKTIVRWSIIAFLLLNGRMTERSKAAEVMAYEMPTRGICAHRGASDTHPENTLSSFREAILLGTQMIEFDVGLTKDGELVLMHDSTVDRTTDGQGKLAELTLAAVQKLDAGSWKNKKFKGERVPTLRQALDMMPDNIWLNVHLKDGGTELAEKAAKTILNAERVHQCFLACNAEAAAAAKDIAANIQICNMERQADSEQYVAETIAAEADFIQLLGEESVSPKQTELLRSAGVRINYCCANDASKTKELFAAGVEFPLVDKLKDLIRIADNEGIPRLTPMYRSEAPIEKPAVQVFKDGEAQEVPEFKDQKQWISHDLWVETEFDSDGDERLDRMHVSVTRPRQTDTQGLKVPIVYVSSPYFSGTAAGPRDFFWDPKQELGQESPAHSDPPSIAHQSRRVVISSSHLRDWVPRGFAVVHSASPGTGLSQGCPTIGGDNESLAPKAVIDWMCGRAKGFSTPYGDKPVTAFWSTGNVGMTGTSYNGTIPLAAATTGVEGLKAIIPIAPNTSYYHYYRSNGLVRHPGGYLGEDVDVLYNFINSGNPERREFCNCNVRDKEMADGQDRVTGDYNAFWAGRDYINDLGPMKTPLLMAHAFNDWNVMPEHSVRIYKAVQAKGVPVQCYFHQGGHGGPPPLKMMNRWFTRYVCGVENDVENDPKAWVVRGHDDRLKPTSYADYPNPAATAVTLHPTKGGAQQGTLSTKAEAGQGTETLTDNFSFDGATLAQAEWTQHRLLYVTPTLKNPVHISGTCQMTIRLACDKPAANLSVWLVSLPWNSNSKAKIFENVITRGWADPQNTKSLSESQPLVPGEFNDYRFDLQPDDHVVPAGQQLGLMVFSSDRDFTLWPTPGTKVTVDLDHTKIRIPIVGGNATFSEAFQE